MFTGLKKLEAKHQTIFAVVIGFSVICFWRGIWGLLDIYLFPANRVLSLWTSVILGLIILIITHYIVYMMLPRNR